MWRRGCGSCVSLLHWAAYERLTEKAPLGRYFGIMNHAIRSKSQVCRGGLTGKPA